MVSSEIDGPKKCQLIRNNAVFRQIVASELGVRFSKKMAVAPHAEPKAVTKASSPAAERRPDGQDQPRRYSPINEESSEEMTKLEKGQRSHRDVQQQNSIETAERNSGLRMNVEIGDSPNESTNKVQNLRESMNNSVHESGSGRAALKLRGVPVVKSVKLDEATKTLQTPKQSDV